MDRVRRMAKPLVGLCQPRMNIEELELYINNRRDRLKEENFREIKKFISEDRRYVTKLKVLKETRSKIEGYQAKGTDVNYLFGSLDSLIELHDYTLPALLAMCTNIEDILGLFANQIYLFKIYIEYRWIKSTNEFKGKQVFNHQDAIDMNLPEQRIKEYLNFHEHLKNTIGHIKNSELFIKSVKSLSKLFLQVQYAKDLASVNFLPLSADGFVNFVDNFQVKIENLRFLPYRIYFCVHSLYLVTEEMRFDFDISFNEISLNPMEDDELLFELTIMPGNKVCIFKSTTPSIKNEWTKLLKDILYMQIEEEKLKIRKSEKVRFEIWINLNKLQVRMSESKRKNITELKLCINNQRNHIGDEDFREIKNFIDEEHIYVIKLKKLKDARRIIKCYQAPETDLKCLFGLLDSIIELHEYILPTRLTSCKSIEDLLDIFANHINMFRIYIYDQWTKSRHEFNGKQALLKKLEPEDVSNMSLPEGKIIEYIIFHEHLKKSCERIKNSELFLKSFQSLRNLILQLKYAEDLASVELLPPSVSGFVYIVDNFQVKIDNSRFITYRIYFCANYLYLVTEAMRFDFQINTREISLNPMEDDELLFELLIPGLKVFIFKSETPDVKNAWTNLLTDILYRQVEEEKLKIRNSLKRRSASD